MNRAADATPRDIADPRVAAIVAWFEQFSAADLRLIDRYYATDARFKDPFNDVTGIDAITAVYRHMFETLEQPRFVINDVIVQRDQCFIGWDFEFRLRRLGNTPQTIRGASHLRLDASGLITVHRDYWDAAEELYEKIPLLGSLMRWLRRRASA
ncbi:nuclear transport factor 2 family protein [Piscinibacter sakaiensis]|uniref:nuclear transport factor 2 family protein n=1 Tax=Piscinibacter sakaiensis TaxID=1547922 RepID=UPI003AACD063